MVRARLPPCPCCQVNEDLDQRTLLRKYERELRRLRAELQQKSKDLVDKRLVLQVGGLDSRVAGSSRPALQPSGP